MKIKKIIGIIMIVAMMFAVTACGNKTENTSNANNTQLEENNMQESDSNNADAKRMEELYNKQAEIFGVHNELWEKVFKNDDHSNTKPITSAEDSFNNLVSLVESCKDMFTEDEMKSLYEDLEKVKDIDRELYELSAKMQNASSEGEGDVSSDTGVSNDNTSTGFIADKFPEFQGKDLEGNDVSSEIFAKNKITAINFWYNECKPCIDELSYLNKLNEFLKERGCELIGINEGTVSMGKDNGTVIEEAKNILSVKGAKYRNIYFDKESEAGKLTSQLIAFPTTILVDSNGKVIGNPIGGISNDDELKALQEKIEEILAKK